LNTRVLSVCAANLHCRFRESLGVMSLQTKYNTALQLHYNYMVYYKNVLLFSVGYFEER